MASIRMRNGAYQITVSCGYDVKGKKKLETTTFTPDPAMSPKKQEKAAKEFAVLFEQRVKNGLAMDGRKITLEEFAHRWLSEYAEMNLQPGTVWKYREELRDKILPALGHLRYVKNIRFAASSAIRYLGAEECNAGSNTAPKSLS